MKVGFVPKYCPKCGGNVYLDVDFDGWYEKCLQCGLSCDLESLVELDEAEGNLEKARGAPSKRVELRYKGEAKV